MENKYTKNIYPNNLKYKISKLFNNYLLRGWSRFGLILSWTSLFGALYGWKGIIWSILLFASTISFGYWDYSAKGTRVTESWRDWEVHMGVPLEYANWKLMRAIAKKTGTKIPKENEKIYQYMEEVCKKQHKYFYKMGGVKNEM